MKSDVKGKSAGWRMLEAVKRHLDEEAVVELPDPIYLESAFQFVESEENTRREVDLVQKLTRMEPYDDVLDLGCGQGRHTVELCRRDFSAVVGVDNSKIVVRMARKRLLEEGLKGGRFSQGDARALKFSDERFDAVLMLGNVLGAFDKARDEEQVFSEVARVLRERGSAVFEVADGEWLKANFQPRAYGWNDQKLFVCTERTLASDGRRLIVREVVVDPEKGMVAENFSAERLFSADELMTLLVKHGFTEVYRHNFQKRPFSNRRDLMLVENRIFVTASKPVKRAVLNRSGRLDRTDPFPVQVFLGDPHIFDPLSETTRMQHRAFEALKGLKEALGSLKGFEFSYFDNHQHYVKELLKKRPAFVFNVCTEGLFNEADKELHVPALLDALSIPYAGSDPAAVALCYDRSYVRNVARAADILVPEEVWLAPGCESITVPRSFPVLIKPALKEGRAKEYTLVKSIHELREAVRGMSEEFPKTPLVVQEYLPGKEVCVGVFGNRSGKLSAFPVLDGVGGALFEEVRYVASRATREEQKKGVLAAFSLFRRLGARDWALFKFRHDCAGNLKLISGDLNPSLFPDGELALMARLASMEYAELLEKLLLIGIERNLERLALISGL